MAAAALRELRLQSLKRAHASAECLRFERDQADCTALEGLPVGCCGALLRVAKRSEATSPQSRGTVRFGFSFRPCMQCVRGSKTRLLGMLCIQEELR